MFLSKQHYWYTFVNTIDKHLLVFDSDNNPIGSSFFKYSGNKIISLEEFFPAMITTNKKIIQQDCLCYILKRVEGPF